jgi:glucose-6-phosphate 1-dehydrogenase
MQTSHLRASCTGMAQGDPPEPCIIVIFGVAGDLARHTLVPSLYALHCRQLLPTPFAIIGVARRAWDDHAFREEMRHHAQSQALFHEDTWRQFAQHLYFVGGDFSASATQTYINLRDTIAKRRDECQMPDHVLFHFSTPPSLYGDIIKASGETSLLQSDRGWRRVMLEKPFGHNEASARDLDWLLQGVLDETQIYRVDHYLGKETVQNMFAVRFANPAFEPIWNRHYIDHVQITVAEDEGIGSRAGYYDKTGVARDMLQNHLLHLLCMTAMEPPSAYHPTAVRDETLNVLKAVRPLDVKADGVFGQYGRGAYDGQPVCAYREEDNVPETSTTPTFVALKLTLDTWRWAGVPFYLRTGKRLPRKVADITLWFQPMSSPLFPAASAPPRGNRLTFRLQPNEGMQHTFMAKQPGPGMCVQPVTMAFRYDTAFAIDSLPNAYEWLILDAIHGDQTLFPRSDWIYQAWSIIDPLVMYWEALPPRDLPNYPAGTWGPEAASSLIGRDGRSWFMT